MKLEQITISLMGHYLNHISTSEAKRIDLDKKTMMIDALKYIEDYCTKSGFELLAPTIEGSIYTYHLVKK